MCARWILPLWMEQQHCATSCKRVLLLIFFPAQGRRLGKLVLDGRSLASPAVSCAGQPRPTSTRGSAGNHAATIPCSPQLGPVCPDDSGSANSGWFCSPAEAFRTRTQPLCLPQPQGQSAAMVEPSGRPASMRGIGPAIPGESRAEGNTNAASQDHPLCRR